MAIIKLIDSDQDLLEGYGIGPGSYPAAGNHEFIFPADTPDFHIRFFEKNGALFAELPDDLEPAFEGTTLDLNNGGDVAKEYEGKIFAIYV
ncbi:hypothetical protein [Methanoregula formicica]|uniref:Uncharacterized protein n=1 Tax=Methanoregula formicica (strain DSM 22288 / NBRC 105244 / SMSP) TaxID=593750 RepID=L0HDH3_METFS|nr:hypothetical protein [Methanoregula formicica]AGB02762.1 hypothetical protein Metfor_1736 [Methanoregula formicica SMSP]